MKTPKAQALGKALRQAREEKGLKLREFAAELSRDPGVLSRWETGDRTPKPEQVAQILTLLGVRGAKYESVMALTQDTDAARWLGLSLPEQRQQLAALLDYEQTATTITNTCPLLIPGLLQTPAYVRAIMTAGAPADEVTTRVAVRIGRKEILDRADPVRLTALIGEAALCQAVAAPPDMVEQMRSLLETGQQSNIEIRVLPFGSKWHPALEGPFTLIESDTTLPVVHLEVRGSVLFLHQENDVNGYRAAAEAIAASALDPRSSATLIAKYAKRWEKA